MNLPKRANRSRKVQSSGRVTPPIAPVRKVTGMKNYEALCQSLREAVQHSLLDLYESPELEEVRQAWVAAYKAEDSAALTTLISAAQRIAREAKKKNRREE